MRFEDLDFDRKKEILHKRQSISFLIDRKTAGWDKVDDDSPDGWTSEPFEVPPGPDILMSHEDLATVFCLTGPDPKGEWIRFFLCVYLAQGRIVFRRLSEDDFEANVSF